MAAFEYRIQMQFPDGLTGGRSFRTYEQVVDWDEERVADYCSLVRDIPGIISVRVWRRPISTWHPWDWAAPECRCGLDIGRDPACPVHGRPTPKHPLDFDAPARDDVTGMAQPEG